MPLLARIPRCGRLATHVRTHASPCTRTQVWQTALAIQLEATWKPEDLDGLEGQAQGQQAQGRGEGGGGEGLATSATAGPRACGGGSSSAGSSSPSSLASTAHKQLLEQVRALRLMAEVGE